MNDILPMALGFICSTLFIMQWQTNTAMKRNMRNAALNRKWIKYCIAREHMFLASMPIGSPGAPNSMEYWKRLVDILSDAEVEIDNE